MILMYHNVGKDAGFNTISESLFINQLEYLIRNKYEILSFESYVNQLDGRQHQRKSITITFDDAYESFDSIVYPILEDRAIPAILFVPTGHVDGFNSWDVEKTDQRLKIMNWNSIINFTKKELITLGSHGHSHRHLSHLSGQQIFFEIRTSKDLLEEHSGVKMEYFSYPYGQHKDFNRFVVRTLQENDFKAACSTNWGRTNTLKDLFALNRIEVEPRDTIESFARKLTLNYHLKAYKQKIKNVINQLR